MKAIRYLGIVAFLAVFGICAASEEAIVESSVEVYPVKDAITDIVNATINQVIKNISDPLVVDSLNITLPSGILSGSANISNLTLDGVHSIFAPNITLNILNLALNITIKIPDITASLKYKADGLLAGFLPLYGDGNIDAHLSDLILSINGSANLTGGIRLKDFSFNLTLANATFGLTGLLNSTDMSEALTELLNDNLVSLLDDNAEFITYTLSPVIKVLINTILKGNSTVEDLHSVLMEETSVQDSLMEYLGFLT